MAEGETIVWNKKLLVLSLVLAVAAAAMFYIYTSYRESKARGESVQVLRWKREIPAGEATSKDDVEVVSIPAKTYQTMQNVAQFTEQNMSWLVNGHVNRTVRRGQFVLVGDLVQKPGADPAREIGAGKRAITLRVDPDRTPGNLLRVNGRADLIGMLTIKGKTKNYYLIKNLRVLAVGGVGPSAEEDFGGGRASRYESGLRVYRSVTVELDEQVCLQLADLMPRVEGKLLLLVRNPDESAQTASDREMDNKINPEIIRSGVLDMPLPSRTEVGPTD